MRISATGCVIRSLGGIGQSEGCVIDVEQPAISNAIAHSHVFDAVTVDYLAFDNCLCADVFGCLLGCCQLLISGGKLTLQRKQLTPLLVVLLCLL